MRLLIVDDEYYTRQGFRDEIDLSAVGIDEIAEADDGINALSKASSFQKREEGGRMNCVEVL